MDIPALVQWVVDSHTPVEIENFAHLLEIETVKQCIERGIIPPVWSSANTPGGDEKNAAYLEKYKPRVKML